MAEYEIPLTPTPQTFGVSLDGTQYRLTLYWAQGWTMNIADALDNPIVNGIPLVTGADLIAQYRYLGLTGSLIVFSAPDPDALPTFDNLGIGSRLLFITS